MPDTPKCPECGQQLTQTSISAGTDQNPRYWCLNPSCDQFAAGRDAHDLHSNPGAENPIA